jgi:hypothetical protein
MKTLVLVFTALLTGCSQAAPTLMADDLIKRNWEFDGKDVRVCGLLTDSLENCRLSGHPARQFFKDERVSIAPGIWVSAGDSCLPGNAHPMSGLPKQAWVLVEGTFHTGGEFGHLGVADHQLVASTIERTAKPCRAQPDSA